MSACAVWAQAHANVDCPYRDQPYSIDVPLLDVLLKPEAKAVVERDAPALMQNIPPWLAPVIANTTPPTGTTEMSLRLLASLAGQSEASLTAVDRALKALPITAADRTARCARYDVERPRIQIPQGHPRLLMFEKVNGYLDEPSLRAADAAVRTLAQRRSWALVVTDKGGAITSQTLKKFDAVVWNNVSGDALTLTQRAALQQYIEHGGGFVGIHGSGGDPMYFWDWYVDTLIGARFKGHPSAPPEAPQFQEARIRIDPDSPIARDLAPGWTMTDEWYSFKTNPRAHGAVVVATLDESTYAPVGMGNLDLKMGDHPIAWTQCIGQGRSFYSAIGHRPETYSEPHYTKLLEEGIAWAAGAGERQCHE